MTELGSDRGRSRCRPANNARSGEDIRAKPWHTRKDRPDCGELIARFFAFRPDTGRGRLAERLRDLKALTSKRSQLVERRKRLPAQIRAHHQLGIAAKFEDIDTELKAGLDSPIKGPQDRTWGEEIERQYTGRDRHRPQFIPGIGSAPSNMKRNTIGILALGVGMVKQGQHLDCVERAVIFSGGPYGGTDGSWEPFPQYLSNRVSRGLGNRRSRVMA